MKGNKSKVTGPKPDCSVPGTNWNGKESTHGHVNKGDPKPYTAGKGSAPKK